MKKLLFVSIIAILSITFHSCKKEVTEPDTATPTTTTNNNNGGGTFTPTTGTLDLTGSASCTNATYLHWDLAGVVTGGYTIYSPFHFSFAKVNPGTVTYKVTETCGTGTEITGSAIVVAGETTYLSAVF
jgi:hypothetical protein